MCSLKFPKKRKKHSSTYVQHTRIQLNRIKSKREEWAHHALSIIFLCLVFCYFFFFFAFLSFATDNGWLRCYNVSVGVTQSVEEWSPVETVYQFGRLNGMLSWKKLCLGYKHAMDNFLFFFFFFCKLCQIIYTVFVLLLC